MIPTARLQTTSAVDMKIGFTGRSSLSRRIAKWAGLVVCVVVLGMWGVSTTCALARLSPRSQFESLGGAARVNWHPNALYPFRPRWIVERTHFNHGIVWPELRSLSRDRVSFILPFWYLFALVAMPTAALWIRDRTGRVIA